MINKNDLNDLIDRIIELVPAKEENDFCCGRYSDKEPTYIIETDVLKIIYRKNNECEVVRKKNRNPVIERDKNKKIFRQHGEFSYLKRELYTLAQLDEELKNLNPNFKYD